MRTIRTAPMSVLAPVLAIVTGLAALDTKRRGPNHDGRQSGNCYRRKVHPR